MATFGLRRRLPALLALAVVAGVAFATWRGGPAEAADVPRLKAGDIADAVLFNDGPAAKYLAGLRLGTTQWTDELREIQHRIRAKVEADPEFAATFVARMQSGNPRDCAKAVSDLGQLARDVLYARYGRDQVDRTAMVLDKSFAAGAIGSGAILNNEFSHAYDLDADINMQFDSVLVLDFVRDTSWHADHAILADTAVDVARTATLMLATVAVFNLPMEYSDRTSLAGEVLLNHLATDLRAGAVR
jgi:hypothetical protein